VSELEQFVSEGSQMMVKLPAMRQLEAKISAIKSWKDRLATVFSLSSPDDSVVPVGLHMLRVRVSVQARFPSFSVSI